MTNFQQAHVLLMQQGRWSGEIMLFPSTDLDINATVHKVRYGYNPIDLNLGLTAHLVFDNHFVGVHAPAHSGVKLKVYAAALDVLLVRQPEHTTITQTSWDSDGSYRIGYTFNDRMKALSDFEKVAIIYRAMMDTMRAAETFSAWAMHRVV